MYVGADSIFNKKNKNKNYITNIMICIFMFS